MNKFIPFSGRYSVEMCRKYPRYLFVFGDNLRRIGKGGQAIIRDEPNTLGVATKRTPGHGPDDFFEEGNVQDMLNLVGDLHNVQSRLEQHSIILPVFDHGGSTLGCGLAELPIRAPTLYAMINAWQRKVLSS